MSGGGALGGAAATGLGALLAPETFGASLAVPAALGAAGGALGSGVTGGNPLAGALTGGASGLAGGFLSGLLDGGDTAADIGANDLSGLPGPDTPTDIDAPSGTGSMSDGAASAAAAPATTPSSVKLPDGSNPNSGSWLSNLLGNSPNASSNGNVAGTAANGSSDGIGGYISNHPLQTAGLGLGVLGALMPTGSNPVNVGGTAASVNATNPGFNASLPKYNYNSVQTPYQGNWYTYGLRPTTPQVTNTLTAAKRGGLMKGYAQGGTSGLPIPQRKPPVPNNEPLYGGYAAGGRVRGYAMGGMSIGPMPTQSPQMGQLVPQAPMPTPQGQPTNPLQSASQFQMGQKIGKLLRNHIQKQSVFSTNGMVNGPGKGQDDAVPAKLSKDEYVLSADIPAALGDGSSEAGGKILDKMVTEIRQHKTSHGSKFPPKAKNPLAYIGRS